MSTQLTLFGSDDFEQIAKETGANINTSPAIIPTLKINREAETETGQRIPTGTFFVSQGDVAVYGKPVTFRPFINTFQYLEYDAGANKYPNKTIIIKSLFDEAHDELGGLKCGKVSQKDLDQLTEGQRLAQKAIHCYRLLFGLVTMDGVTADGTETRIENLPVLWKMRGTNFNAPKNALDSITKLRHLFFNHNLTLNTKREKQGSNVYYTALVEADLANVIELTENDAEIYKMFQEHIDRENRYVLNKWREAKKITDSSDVMEQLELLDDDISDL